MTKEEIMSFINFRIAELESIAQEKIVGQDETADILSKNYKYS